MSPSLLELCHFLQMTLCCIALSTVQLTIHYFRLILMTYAHGPATTCLNLMQVHDHFSQETTTTPPNDLCVNGLSLERVHEYKYLGVHVADLRPNMVKAYQHNL